jgi:hypothetical protein
MSNTLFKKVTASVAALSVVLSIVSPVTGVKAADASVEAANRLASLGVIVDSSSNPSAYNLGSSITRREMLKVMMNLSSVEVSETCTGKFSDLPATDWGCKYAEAALSAGFIAANPKFRPNDLVSKSEALKMIMQARGLSAKAWVTPWEKSYVEGAVEAWVLASAFTDYSAAAKRSMVFVSADSAVTATTKDDSTVGGDNTDVNLDDLFGDLFGNSGSGVTSTWTVNNNSGTTSTGTSNNGSTTVVTGGNVEVSLNPTSPVSQTVPQSGLVPFGKFDFTAGSNDVSVNSIKLKREGLSNRSDIRRVYFEQNGMRVSNRTNVATDDTVLISFSPALVVKAGSTVTLNLVVELKDGGATVGAEHRFSILSASDVDSSATVQWSYPVRTATMKIGSYTVGTVWAEVVTVQWNSYTVWEKNVTLWELRLTTQWDKNNIFKSVTLRNDGTADIAASLTNLALYNDWVKISSTYELSWRDITFSLNSEIENGRTENFQIRADIASAERTTETYEFQVRNSTDISVVEKETGFSAPISLNATPLAFGTVTIEWGDLLLSRDTSYTLNQTVAASTSDVVLWASKLNVSEPITIEDVWVALSSVGNGLDKFSSLKLVVGSTTVATYTPAAGETSFTFETTFTISENTPIRILWTLRSNANGTYTVSSVKLGNNVTSNVKYVSNDENAVINGTVAWIATSVANATLTLTRNDWVDNNTLVPGAKDVLLLWFALRANDVSDVKITSLKPVKSWTVTDANITNVRLYQGDTLLATKNNFDFNSLNVTITKNQSVSFRIVADFSNSVTAAQTVQLTLNGANVTARNISSNETVTPSTNVTSENFAFSTGGTVNVTVNSSQASRSIVTPSTSETSVFKFDLEAKNDKLRLTDLYIRNTSGLQLASALRSSSLTIAGRTITWVVLSDSILHFPFGSTDALVISRDQVVNAELKVSFYDSNSRTNQAFQFEIPTTAQVTWGVTWTINGMRILSDSTGAEIDRGVTSIQSRAHLLARSKPTVARQSEVNSSTAYKFSVTADANRKVKLNSLTFNVKWIVQNWASFTLKKDWSNDVIQTVNANLAISGTDVVFNTLSQDNEVAAGTTMTYVVEVSWVDTWANVDKTREVKVTDLVYQDDVDTPVAISVADYNLLPTTASTYKY